MIAFQFIDSFTYWWKSLQLPSFSNDTQRCYKLPCACFLYRHNVSIHLDRYKKVRVLFIPWMSHQKKQKQTKTNKQEVRVLDFRIIVYTKIIFFLTISPLDKYCPIKDRNDVSITLWSHNSPGAWHGSKQLWLMVHGKLYHQFIIKYYFSLKCQFGENQCYIIGCQ